MAIAQGQFTLTEVNDGSNGAGVVKIDNYYYASSSDTPVPSTANGKWKTNISNLTDKYGKSFPYLWNYEVTTLENGSTLSTSPELISHYGTDGRGIHEVKEYYLRSSSSSGINKPTSEPTSIPDSGISNNTWYSEPVATTSTYKYLWNCEKIVYTDGTNGGYTTPAIIGTHGSTGSTGAAAVTLSLDNDFISIPCKSNGDFINSTFLSSLTVVLSVYSGATLQQIQTTSSSGTYYRSKIKVNATGITATLANAANSDGTINLTFSNMTAADKATVTISLHSSNTGHSNSNKKAEVSLEIVKNKQGKDGEYIYISTSRQSYVLEREKIRITLNAYQKQGANPPIAYSGDWAVDGASIASGESNSSTCIIDTSNSTGNIVVTFSKDGVILDKETIVALSDGKPGDPGDPGTVQGTKLFYSATASDITAPYVDLTSSKTSSDVEGGQIAFNTTTWYSEAKFFGVKNTTDSTKYGAWDIRQSDVVCRPGYAPCVWKIELILSQADGKWYCAYSPQKVSLLEAATIAAQIQATGREETDNLAVWCKEAGLSIIDGSTIVAGSIDAVQIKANSITANQIASNTITANQIASNAITAEKIEAKAIKSQHIEADNLAAIKGQMGVLTAGAIVSSEDMLQSSTQTYDFLDGTYWQYKLNGWFAGSVADTTNIDARMAEARRNPSKMCYCPQKYGYYYCALALPIEIPEVITATNQIIDYEISFGLEDGTYISAPSASEIGSYPTIEDPYLIILFSFHLDGTPQGWLTLHVTHFTMTYTDSSSNGAIISFESPEHPYISFPNFQVRPDGSITSTSGKIGGWIIGDGGASQPILFKRTFANNGLNYLHTTGMAALDSSDYVAFWAGCPNGLTPWEYNKQASDGTDYSDVTPFFVTSQGYFAALNGRIGCADIQPDSLSIYNDSDLRYQLNKDGISFQNGSELKLGSVSFKTDNNETTTYATDKYVIKNIDKNRNTISAITLGGSRGGTKTSYTIRLKLQGGGDYWKPKAKVILESVDDNGNLVPVLQQVNVQYYLWMTSWAIGYDQAAGPYTISLAPGTSQFVFTWTLSWDVFDRYAKIQHVSQGGGNGGTAGSASREVNMSKSNTITIWSEKIEQQQATNNIEITGNLIPSSAGYNLGARKKNGGWQYIYTTKGLYSESGNEIAVSDKNKKYDIQPLSEAYGKIFDSLRPVTFKYNIGTSDRLHTGFIAQEVLQATLDSGLTTQDFAAYCEWETEEGEKVCGLRYSEFIPLTVCEIQKLKARIYELEQETIKLQTKIKEIKGE